MKTQQWSFSFLDTSFCRQPAPFNAGEGARGFVRSVFPPDVATLQGAIRTALADEQGWRPDGAGAAWPVELGGPDDLGQLELRGPYLLLDGEPYFPLPPVLVETRSELVRLVPGEEVECDLGRVRLPVPEKSSLGARLLEDRYLSRRGLKAILEGGTPRHEDMKRATELWVEEERTGLEREDRARTALEGHLYNCVHVRPRQGVTLVVFVSGIPENWKVPRQRLVPLGGEGRLAAVEIGQSGGPEEILPEVPELAPAEDGKIRFTVTLITPGWYGSPEEVRRVIREGPLGVPGRCVAACLGRASQVGGWDLANHQPRPLVPVLPAGSTWFYEGEGDLCDPVARLHGRCLGPRGACGLGQIVIGKWRDKVQ